MPPADLIVQTPRGSSIQKTEEGQFLVCDAENQCHLTHSLYLAEEKLKGMECGYVFPYAPTTAKALADAKKLVGATTAPGTKQELIDLESTNQRFRVRSKTAQDDL